MDKKKIFKYEFKPQFSTSIYWDLSGYAQRIVILFTQEVEPVLHLFGLLSDDYIRKCFYLESMEDIYKDAMAKNATRLSLLEDMAAAKGEDFWKPIRDEESKAKKPTEDGFVFRRIPWAGGHKHWMDKLCKGGLKVDKGKLKIDERAIKAECLIYPTDRMREIYDLAVDFCEAVNGMNLKRENVLSWLFIKDGKKIKPNIKGILVGTQPWT
jgi:hypothetical protein